MRTHNRKRWRNTTAVAFNDLEASRTWEACAGMGTPRHHWLSTRRAGTRYESIHSAPGAHSMLSRPVITLIYGQRNPGFSPTHERMGDMSDSSFLSLSHGGLSAGGGRGGGGWGRRAADSKLSPKQTESLWYLPCVSRTLFQKSMIMPFPSRPLHYRWVPPDFICTNDPFFKLNYCENTYHKGNC